MSPVAHSGFIRLQTQSHVAATQWKKWAQALGLESLEIEDVWNEIGYPLFTATRQLPPISFILQLRSERREANLFDFKDEIAPLLTFLNLLDQLKDDKLGGDKAIAVLFRFYRTKVCSEAGEHRADELVENFIVDLCKLILVAKIIGKQTITLIEILNIVIRKQTSVDKVVELGLQALGSQSYASSFQKCLEGLPSLEQIACWEEEEEDEEEEDDDDEEEDDDDEEEDDDDEDNDEDDEKDDEKDDDDDDDEGKKRARKPTSFLDRFVFNFRKALQAFYAIQVAYEEGDNAGKERKLLNTRLAALKEFDPLHAIIPSLDEAEEIATRRGQSIDSNRIIKRSAPPRSARSTSRRSAPPALSSSGGGLAGLSGGSGSSAGGSAAASSSTTAGGSTGDSATAAEVGTSAVESSGDAGETIDPAVLAAALEATDAGQDEDAAPTPSEEDIVKLAPVSAANFSQKVHQLGQLLGAAERGDEAVWQLFLDPERLLEERQALAAALITAESPANQAYRLIKGATQFIGLKRLLQLDHLRQRNRRFTTQISGFINIAQAAHKNFLPNDRQLEGLDIILDHTANALLRLENLRINRHYAQEHPNHYTAEAVTAYREKALASVQAFVESESLEIARTQAQDDTAAMVDLFSTEHYVAELVADCRAYAEQLQQDGHTQSLEKLAATFQEIPIEFSLAEPAEPESEPLPANLQTNDKLGDIFQRACNHLSESAWAVLWERHEPTKVIPQIVAVAHAALSPCFVLKPEHRRHATRPRMPITVVSLEKLTANAELRHPSERVTANGTVLYIEGYEDGTYTDLLELREYTQVRMQASNEGGEEGSDPLQTGEKYLYTLGRTQDFFGANASAIIAKCVRDEDGEMKIFPTFRPKVGD